MNEHLLSKIMRLNRELAETKDINELLAIALEQISEVVGAELGFLILLNTDNKSDFLVHSKVSKIEEHIVQNDSISRTILDKVILEREPIVLTDALSDHRFSFQSSVIDLQIRSVMCVPLITRGNVIGAIYVENRTLPGAFFQDDLEPLVLFANQAGVSIENALIIADLEERVAKRTAEVERGWQEAIEANRMRTIFLGQLSHDMHTPATVIGVALSLMDQLYKSDPSTEQTVKKYLLRAKAALNQITALTQDVFELSKSELKLLRIHPTPIELNQFLNQMGDIAQGLPWPETVTFQMDILDAPIHMNLDPVRIQQVLMNLLSNALKFTESGKVVLYAQIDKNDSDFIQIGVSDTGEGIQEKEHAAIFKRFHQADSDLQRRSTGMGLGLAISHTLVDMHGGKLQLVSSTIGEGANFAFTLPLQEVSQDLVEK